MHPPWRTLGSSAADRADRLLVLRAVAQVAAIVIVTVVLVRPHTPWGLQIVGLGLSVVLAVTAVWARRRLGLPPHSERRRWWRRGFIALWLLLISVAIALGGGIGSGVAIALSFCAVIAASVVARPRDDEADAE